MPGDIEWGQCVQDATEYTITLVQPVSGGTIQADATTATYGTVVTLSATPDAGKQLDAWDVKDADNNPIGVSKAGTFVMPQSNVTVTATFKDEVVLVPATYSDSDVIEVESTSYPVVWSITRNADATLTFKVVVTGEIPGFVPEVNVLNAYMAMVAADGSWVYSTEDTFEDGEQLSGFFWLKYAGGVKRIDWTDYTIGASNEEASGVESVQDSEVRIQKLIENGQVYILINGVRYNAAGQMVQ